ncbi:MAG: endonuclease/exonuclease/phosphatase family protein [Candidatus Pacearchaeota archaeon]|jgi:endonuclease/exonuclease/phosphatase family metal-dependent hydrolase|nr:endonuclease/exonuclease/phosphatase family protein [Candidatus Pacearchaeota archaeon]|tara:strand:- start:18 stop:731 length:714 start_codon:yes stop_codon:yes gene_type:complete
MKIKILNLNIWNYTNWDKRKPKIAKFIKKYNPDVVFFQEIRDDTKFNKKGDNQAKQLNRELNYPSYVFYSQTDKRKERPGKYKRFCIEGTAILSKFPIIKTEKEMLTKHKNDKYNCGNLFARLRVKNKFVDIINVHFSNSEYFSLLHLLETLKQVEKKKIKPIIAGDFNMHEYKVLHDLTKEDYESSMNYKKYMSYPLRKWTLDYILIPKKYKFKSFECAGKDISDHKSLIAEVEIK